MHTRCKVATIGEIPTTRRNGPVTDPRTRARLVNTSLPSNNSNSNQTATKYQDLLEAVTSSSSTKKTSSMAPTSSSIPDNHQARASSKAKAMKEPVVLEAHRMLILKILR